MQKPADQKKFILIQDDLKHSKYRNKQNQFLKNSDLRTIFEEIINKKQLENNFLVSAKSPTCLQPQFQINNS